MPQITSGLGDTADSCGRTLKTFALSPLKSSLAFLRIITKPSPSIVTQRAVFLNPTLLYKGLRLRVGALIQGRPSPMRPVPISSVSKVVQQARNEIPTPPRHLPSSERTPHLIDFDVGSGEVANGVALLQPLCTSRRPRTAKQEQQQHHADAGTTRPARWPYTLSEPQSFGSAGECRRMCASPAAEASSPTVEPSKCLFIPPHPSLRSPRKVPSAQQKKRRATCSARLCAA